jgi:hypothetical protein
MKIWVIAGVVGLVLFAVLRDEERPRTVPMGSEHAPVQYTPPVSAPGLSTDLGLSRSSSLQTPGGQLYFRGDPCTIDCSGHEAGYAWAEDNGIDDPDDCDGNSESFIEGCKSYIEEQKSGDSDEEKSDE